VPWLRTRPDHAEAPSVAPVVSAIELGLQIDWAQTVGVRVVDSANQPRELGVVLLTLAERRDLANSLPCAAWSAVFAKASVFPLDLLTATDVATTWASSG
jgi:hypothetical protein